MKRSNNGQALFASKVKQIIIANQLFDDGRDLSYIASELNRRRFRQKNGRLFSWKSAADLLDGKNFEVNDDEIA